MGIKQLHKLLRPLAQTQYKIDESWRKKRIGVDAMCWMHRGAVSCAYELIVGIDTDRFVKFFVDMVFCLLFNGCIPFIVFDGCDLPAKQEESDIRKKVRNEAREKVLENARNLPGDAARFDTATNKFAQQGIRITVDMIERIIAALRELKVDFIVAPYEADAQLAYMCRTGFLHAVISEDSDLFVYGCPRVLCKMDKYGVGDLFEMDTILGKGNNREVPEGTAKSVQKLFGTRGGGAGVTAVADGDGTAGGNHGKNNSSTEEENQNQNAEGKTTVAAAPPVKEKVTDQLDLDDELDALFDDEDDDEAAAEEPQDDDEEGAAGEGRAKKGNKGSKPAAKKRISKKPPKEKEPAFDVVAEYEQLKEERIIEKVIDGTWVKAKEDIGEQELPENGTTSAGAAKENGADVSGTAGAKTFTADGLAAVAESDPSKLVLHETDDLLGNSADAEEVIISATENNQKTDGSTRNTAKPTPKQPATGFDDIECSDYEEEMREREKKSHALKNPAPAPAVPVPAVVKIKQEAPPDSEVIDLCSSQEIEKDDVVNITKATGSSSSSSSASSSSNVDKLQPRDEQETQDSAKNNSSSSAGAAAELLHQTSSKRTTTTTSEVEKNDDQEVIELEDSDEEGGDQVAPAQDDTLVNAEQQDNPPSSALNTTTSSVFDLINAEEDAKKGKKGRGKKKKEPKPKKEPKQPNCKSGKKNSVVVKKDNDKELPPKQQKPSKKPKVINPVPNLKFDIALLKYWSPEMFRIFAVLCGCDYNPHLHVAKLAIATAAKLVHCYKERTLDAVVKKFTLPCEPLDYVRNFHLSLSVFRHHIVYDTKKGEVLFFSDALKRIKRLQIAQTDPDMLLELTACTKERACGTLEKIAPDVMPKLCRGEVRPKDFTARPKDPLNPKERQMLKFARERRQKDLMRDAREERHRQAMAGATDSGQAVAGMNNVALPPGIPNQFAYTPPGQRGIDAPAEYLTPPAGRSQFQDPVHLTFDNDNQTQIDLQKHTLNEMDRLREQRKRDREEQRREQEEMEFIMDHANERAEQGEEAEEQGGFFAEELQPGVVVPQASVSATSSGFSYGASTIADKENQNLNNQSGFNHQEQAALYFQNQQTNLGSEKEEPTPSVIGFQHDLHQGAGVEARQGAVDVTNRSGQRQQDEVQISVNFNDQYAQPPALKVQRGNPFRRRGAPQPRQGPAAGGDNAANIAAQQMQTGNQQNSGVVDNMRLGGGIPGIPDGIKSGGNVTAGGSSTNHMAAFATNFGQDPRKYAIEKPNPGAAKFHKKHNPMGGMHF
ncbi:unnamed protein product [Amoebophrya sp. A120]|nr:unnamed protein product [Amoebophrya sp. A120]|eukprot:GSA120T00008768001.1